MLFEKGLRVGIFLVASLVIPLLCTAQETIGFSVQAGESFYVHPAEGISIFSDFTNNGNLGSRPGSVINFYGTRWSNRTGSRIVDENADGMSGLGGQIRFSSRTGAVQYIDNQTSQQAYGFPGLSIASSGNVVLEGSDLNVRRNLHFEAGHLILNNRNAVLLPSATITGYDQNKFVVTGSGTNGGYLVRNASGSVQTDIVFPVGTAPGSYTPASLNYTGVAQNLRLRVFDNAYDRAIFGMPDNVNFVPKTWNVSLAQADPNASLSIHAQHNASDEGANFTANRSTSFLSRYLSATDVWDVAAGSGTTAGNLTTGSAIGNAFLNTRTGLTGLGVNNYFAKSVSKSTTVATLRIPEGISPNNDGLNDKFVIQNLRPTDKVRLEIYNRWQSLVFRDLNYKNTFEGIGNQNGLVNNILPDGTYYYILNINGEKPVTGYIIINR